MTRLLYKSTLNRALNWLQMVITAFLLLVVPHAWTPRVQAACLLSYDQASPLSQGEALARFSLQGGSEGFGTHLDSRLGLNDDRELHLRLGGCHRASLWGWAMEAGVTQNIFTAAETGLIDLGVRVSAVALLASNDQEEFSELGFQPVVIATYPFDLTSDRSGFGSLSIGTTSYFTDRKDQRTSRDNGNTTTATELSSTWAWRPLIALSAGVEIIPGMPLALEVRWQSFGVYGGASIGYAF